ncbi:HAD family hydrolase [Nocardia sp. CNY236]|uniref:HAD family hydrolase n=1 Tax=Nocardia sp. CNY236 TaxID=1169152 RepID=UPI0006865407|nr:HAD family hydrolase [Nocardia sp. CNY236]
MAIEAVLFDFSGTLFRLEYDESWSADFTRPGGRPFEVREKVEIVRRMTASVEHSVALDAQMQYTWENRDLDPEWHRMATVEVLRRSGVPTDEQAERLYARLVDPLQWTPYPDTGAALKRCGEHGIPVAVVSNVPFDIRPSFAARAWDRLVCEFTLSYEVGLKKPDPQIFRSALDTLGVRAEAALMIGDSVAVDGAVTALGCSFARVDALPTVERQDALLNALGRYGLADTRPGSSKPARDARPGGIVGPGG